MKQYKIDVAKVSDVAHVGVRRAVLFMGLGLNAAHREDFNDYQLHKIKAIPGQTGLPIDFFPRDLPPDRVSEFKAEFATWIVACGFRELQEHYALFLDHIHRHCLTIFQIRGKLGDLDPKKAQGEFNRRLGIPDKLDKLESRFSVAPTHADSIKQLYEARNCLTHDHSVIMPKRCDANGQFVLTWMAMDQIAIGEKSGAERPVIDLIGNRTDEPMTIALRVVRRERKFASGSKLTLSQQDLWEICFFFAHHAIPSAMKSFVAFLQANNVTEKAQI